MKTIYVIVGRTGEYSDRVEWMVEAWSTKEKAVERIKFLEEKLLELGAKDERTPYEERDKIEEIMNQYDPSFRLDYTGTSYYLDAVDLKD